MKRIRLSRHTCAPSNKHLPNQDRARQTQRGHALPRERASTAADGVKARPTVHSSEVHALRVCLAQLTDVWHLPQEPEQASPYPAEAVDGNSNFRGRHGVFPTAGVGLSSRSCGVWDKQVDEMPRHTRVCWKVRTS